MESVRGIGSGVAVGVVRLVDVFVDDAPMESTMRPIDEEVGHEEEEGHSQDEVDPAVVADVVVDLAVAVENSPGERSENNCHGRKISTKIV